MQIASRTYSPDLQNLSPPETPTIAAIKPHKVSILWFPHTGGKKLFAFLLLYFYNQQMEFHKFSVLHTPQPKLLLCLFAYVQGELKANHITNKPKL